MLVGGDYRSCLEEFIGLGAVRNHSRFLFASVAIYVVSLMVRRPAASIQQRFRDG